MSLLKISSHNVHHISSKTLATPTQTAKYGLTCMTRKNRFLLTMEFMRRYLESNI